MRVKFLTGALALTAFSIGLTSCTNDELPSGEPVDPSVISFTATAPRAASRAEATTTATIQSFVVYAFTDGKLLMDSVTVTRSGSEWTYSPTAYWPTSPVNFYAFSPDISGSPNILGNGTASLNMYENPGNIDLLYAVNYGETQKGTPVQLNFRHAFSKVDVYLSSDNSKLQVKVGKVMLGNIYTIGSFTYPKATTAASTPDVVGKWATPRRLTNVDLYASESSPAALTALPTDLGDSNPSGSIDFMMPQELKPLAYDETTKSFVGAYIAVDCKIFDKATGAQLFPNSQTPGYLLVGDTGYGRIMYPATGKVIQAWKLGYSYRYNIEINDPAVLLDGIKFDVTVDEYLNGGQEEQPGM